ncbi:hypothetical protein STENM223S_11507 [Streptomyces tendae]
MATRYGLNQACSCRPRAWASRTAVPSGSQPGSRPWLPDRYCDHGSYAEGHSASAAGRTWKKTVLRRCRTALSRCSISSARCSAARSPARVGQSRLATVASHIPRIPAAARPEDAGRADSRAAADAAGAAVNADNAATVKARRETPPMDRPPERCGSAWSRIVYGASACPTRKTDP